MFILLPLELKTPTGNSRTLPVANVLIVAANVLLFLLTATWGTHWVAGPGANLLGIVLYGFSHVSFWHLLFNMWALWVFGNPVNRRLGNGLYLLSYVGTIVILGLLARFVFDGRVLGASGGVFAVITIALLLMPAARLTVAYGAVFPLSLLVGLFRRPRYGIEWFLCGGTMGVKCIWCLALIPLLELASMCWAWFSGIGGVWSLGHLLGMVCGVVIVLLLPKRISMPSGGRFAAA
jgi:membrane associated rhomboid family serine protease